MDKHVRHSLSYAGEERIYYGIYLVILLIISIPSKYMFYLAAPVVWAVLLLFAIYYGNLFRPEVVLLISVLGVTGTLSMLLESHVAIFPALLWLLNIVLS